MANTMALLQEVDKCIRCNGCYIACKRTWKMAAKDFDTRGVHRVAPHQRVVIKSQRSRDMGVFVRFSCWHCDDPPCTGRCPFKAITKVKDASGNKLGPVAIDPAKCNPNACQKQCVTDCQRGGYPKVGQGDASGNLKAYKCTMCYGRAGLVDAALTAKYGNPLPTKVKADVSGNFESPIYTDLVAKGVPAGQLDRYVPEMEHQPTCVYTCPAKAMSYDTKKNVLRKLQYMYDNAGTDANGRTRFNKAGVGGMYWVSATAVIGAPKADPFIEDHVTPMVSGLLSSPLAKAAVVPTLVVGGLLALSARRAENEKEVEVAMEGEV